MKLIAHAFEQLPDVRVFLFAPRGIPDTNDGDLCRPSQARLTA